MKTFCLKTFRTEHKLTYKTITLQTGIPSSHLSEIERGLRPMSKLYLERIKDKFQPPIKIVDYIENRE
jgi:transcriptional regulator with XRE-family HTH domain